MIVELAGFVQPASFRRLARRGDIVLQTANPQDLDAAAQPGQPRVGDDSSFQALQGLVAIAQTEKRFSAADQCRRVTRIRDDRAIEMPGGTLEILLCQIDIAKTGFRGVER